MVRAVQADEGLGVASRLEDDMGVGYICDLVVRRVDDQQSPARRGDALAQYLPGDLALLRRLGGSGSRREGHDDACLWHLGRDRQDRRTAERMAYEHARRCHGGAKLVKQAFAYMPDMMLTTAGRLLYRHIG